MGSIDLELSMTARVSDGLDLLGKRIESSQIETAQCHRLNCTVRHLDTLDWVTVRTLKLPNENNARIKLAKTAITPYSRSLKMGFADTRVHSLENIQLKSPCVGTRNFIIDPRPAVVTRTAHISGIPHRLHSVDVRMLKTSEYESYLQEARVLKGVSMDRGEVLAVFRRVPIELITRLRYLAEESAIVYTIIGGTNRKRTRVHDMAVVRDAANCEIHLVPHRTRYRAVNLN
jgi:hypothetical protein